jgi:hypothetical protein
MDLGADASNQFVSDEEVIDLRVLTTCDERRALSMREVDEFIEIGLMDFDSRFFKDEILISRAKMFDDGCE